METAEKKGKQFSEAAALRRVRHVEAMIVRYALLLVIVLAVVTGSFAQIARLNAQSRSTDAVTSDAARLLRLQVDEETGIRGYAATGELLFLEPYYAAEPRLHSLLRELQRRSASQSAASQTLRHFALLHASWQRDVAERILQNRAVFASPARERAGKMLVDGMRRDAARLALLYGALGASSALQAKRVAYVAESAIILCILLVAGIGYVMERRSAERERQLLWSVVEKRDTATRMSEWRSKVIAMLAHDFKSTLGAIRAYAEMLEDFPERRSDSQPYRGIRNATEQLARMADEALLMARITSGQLNVDTRPVMIWQVVNETAERYRAKRTIHITPSFEAVMGDRDYLFRVFDNLISNAVKYSPPSSLIDVRIGRTSAGEVAIVVKDDGAGISAQDVPHVFDEYWRASGAPKDTGSGIGLFIVKKIVDAHHGEISLSSSPGGGTRVEVRLPAAEAAAEPRGEESTA